jgi:protein TonB
MFQESLLESSGGIKTRQRWTTLFSLSLEALLIGLLVLIPLLQNQALPRVLWTVIPPVAPPPRGVERPGHGGGGGRPAGAERPALMPPSSIPLHTDLTADGSGPSTDRVGPGLPEGVPWGVDHSTGPRFAPPPVVPRPPQPKAAPRVSLVTEGNVVYRVLPSYPPLARQIGAQGPVVLHAIISREGLVESLQVVSSPHPLLNQAALDAVSQWRFRPYLLNGVPVEVEAQITVNFILPR